MSDRKTGMSMKRKKLVDKSADGQVWFDRDRRRHSIGDSRRFARTPHHAGSCAQQKDAHQNRPEAHEVRPESRRKGHVKPERNQHQGHQLAAEASNASGITNAAAAFPDNRAQHSAAIQRISWKQIEYRQQEISGADKKENSDPGVKPSHCRQLGAGEPDQGKEETCGRTSDGDAKLSLGAVRLRSQSRQATKRMQNDF